VTSREIEDFDTDTCWELAEAAEIGRVAITLRGHPFVFPVNVRVERPMVVFGTGEGLISQGVSESPSIAVEIDDLDPSGAAGWSVVLGGRADPVVDQAEIDALRSLMPFADVHPHLVRVQIDTISGRQVTLHAGPG
jgi:nitroimidazol reductase NimA-like FMN-containing flavoprotein (pyridoxamine 5'-phosphate oxidase superfamily)